MRPWSSEVGAVLLAVSAGLGAWIGHHGVGPPAALAVVGASAAAVVALAMGAFPGRQGPVPLPEPVVPGVPFGRRGPGPLPEPGLEWDPVAGGITSRRRRPGLPREPDPGWEPVDADGIPSGRSEGRRGRVVAVVVTAGLCWTVAGAASVLAERATAGLVPPATGRVRAEMTLVADPVPLPGGGVRAEARFRGKRVALLGFRSAAAALDDRLAGEIVVVDGVAHGPGPFEARLPHRHLAGRVEVDVVLGWRPGHGAVEAANDIRRGLERGASSLTPRQRSLYLGLVVGDDRHQPPDLVAAFRRAGLAHMTAVSGQNIAFLLATAAPLLRRLRLAPRFVATLALLAVFAVVTRAEPSVLRATGMAAVAAYGAAVGRPATGVRALGLAVTVLLLCDPLLVTSLGFRLSVAGSAGILLGAGPLERLLPGPGWLRVPLAVTLAAQLAVSPLLVGAFGSVAAVAVPANLLVAPAAGPITAWGLAAGLVAGVVGGEAAALLHLPTRVLLGWVERVALVAARRPLAQLDAGDLAVVGAVGAVAVVMLLAARRRRAREEISEPTLAEAP